VKELERRLRQDAQALHAEVDPELRARLHAAIARVEPPGDARRSRPRSGWPRLAAGAAVAAGVAAVTLALLRPATPPQPDISATPRVAMTEPALPFPVQALEAEFALMKLEETATAPLEEEQERLERDLDRLREDLRRAF
jgi:hypothetical protein